MPRNGEHKGTSNRGFASMDRAKQRQIASKGGQSVPPEKRSFSQDPSLAAQAGRKGGESVPPEGRSFSQNRELAAEAGRKGGQARGASSRRARPDAAATTQESGKAEAERQGASFDKSHDEPAEGAGDEPKDDFEPDIEEPSNLAVSHDVAPDDLGKSGASRPILPGSHPHGVR